MSFILCRYLSPMSAQEKFLNPFICISGNVDLSSVIEIAKTGVDYISVGALTHSVKNHDFTLLFNEL